MCGIVGIASVDPIRDRTWLVRSRDAMQHRGPDDAGEWWSPDCRVGLGHRRLAILDRSPAGHQPMVDATGVLCVVFNGEIYNFQELREELAAKGHRFYSGSDTEVILAAYREWDRDCLQRFNGMFAFALYDATKQTVLLARDRVGEKPLFYALSDEGLRFASELKALLADPSFPRQIDPTSLDCYLAFGFVPGERCILKGVKKLPPAHALLFDCAAGRVRRWRYWELPLPSETNVTSLGEGALLEELDVLFEDAVRRQLVADVPVGILLSGGVDSSLVTAMAVRSCPRVKTFTVRFPGHRNYDETDHARLVARYFGTEHIELDAVEISPSQILPTVARQYDDPIVDSSMIPTSLVCALVRRHCTVALGGDGGDELFGGYEHYSRLLRLDQFAGWVPRPIRRTVAKAAIVFLPIGFKGRNWLQALEIDVQRGVPLIASYFDRESRRRLLNGTIDTKHVPAEVIRAEGVARVGDLLDRTTRTDLLQYLPEDILVKVDRASMLHSLEVRAPFLDYRIIEFAFGKVPSRLKASANSRKLLLKKLAARVLPAGFDMHRKQGFSIPLQAWLRRGPWYEFFREILLDTYQGPFDRRFLADLLEGQRKGRSNSERLFGLVLFELWRREYKVAV